MHLNRCADFGCRLMIAVLVICFIEFGFWSWVMDAAFCCSVFGYDTDIVVGFRAREEVQGADDMSRWVRMEGDETALG